jgi:hypothetical protein
LSHENDDIIKKVYKEFTWFGGIFHLFQINKKTDFCNIS